jgi:23S rRNA (pseudouridine1915-N3)-methyltransferase
VILVLAVGQKQPAWVDQVCADFLGRFPKADAVTLKEIKAEVRSKTKSVGALKEDEAQRLEKEIPRDAAVIALDERGETLTTQTFGQLIDKYKTQFGKIVFLIGGPDGLDDQLKKKCHAQLRLSAMTLPHGLVRVMLLEQLYRAWSMAKNHPYHRA